MGDQMLFEPHPTGPSSDEFPIFSLEDAPLLADADKPSSVLHTRDIVISKIEDIFEEITSSLLNQTHQLEIKLYSRSRTDNVALASDTGLLQFTHDIEPRTISFPASNAQEAWKFTVLIRILEIIHDALVADIVISKRDIFYRHPGLFIRQAVVDRYIDDLACTFGVARSALNVTAVIKGLVNGNFSITRADGTIVNGLSENEGILIPTIAETDSVSLLFVDWILVVEKEATFRYLVSSEFWNRVKSHAIIITAKGYPDISTRHFLHHLSYNNISQPKIYTLTDFDPDGLNIHFTYTHGSHAFAHQNANLAVPKATWLGVKSSMLQTSNVTELESGSSPEAATVDVDETVYSGGILRLSARDRHKAKKLLERRGVSLEWTRELQVMLFLNIKAEIQLMEARTGGLAEWLERELES